MKFVDEVYDIDAVFIKTCMEKMDQDVATRFVLSGLSLDKNKIEDAFALACREMAIRAEEVEATKKKLAENPGKTENSEPAATQKEDEMFTSKSLLKIVEDILLSTKPKKSK